MNTDKMKEITIIMPTRADFEYLKAAVASIRNRPQYKDCRIIIGADNPTQEINDWLESNRTTLDFEVYGYKGKDETDRKGIVGMVQMLVDAVKTPFIFYMHDDMMLGDYTLERLREKARPKFILSAKRVEPPLYPESPEKFIRNFGMNPSEFKEAEFLQLEKEVVVQDKDKAVLGFFAPHFFMKEDWVGYDPVFAPQSREDSDLAQRFIDADCKLYTVWDALVYHFSGKGSRKRGSNADTTEWKKSNGKNERNYLRKWGTLKHTQYIYPERAPPIKICAHVLVGNEAERIYTFLQNIEPYFDRICLLLDIGQPEEVRTATTKEIGRYMDDQTNSGPTNFDGMKITFQFSKKPIGEDFGEATNTAMTYTRPIGCWDMKLDVDEVFPPDFLGNLRNAIKEITNSNPNVSVIGFPRVNLLDNKVSNDIPREHWFTAEFDKYPAQPANMNNPDVQYRLTQGEQWVGKVHEVPESVYNRDKDRIAVVPAMQFFHPKDRKRQFEQEKLYAGLQKVKEPITKYVYDSVMFTVEGITEHARQECKELKKRGNQVFILDTNFNRDYGTEWEEFYKPVDVYKDNYVTIINQPPVRWAKSLHLKNCIGFLAFEGMLPKDWTEYINKCPIIELWTPSTYCKEMFIKSGVTKNIVVIPHGVDPEVWTPVGKKLNDEFTFLASGTYHNNRKGLDLVAKAFSEEFTPEEKVKLIFKVNKIYDPNKSFQDYIRPFIKKDGNTNIEYLDENMNETELVSLYRDAHCYVAAHRAEGFGINILNAMAVGTPVVTTDKTGNMDFCKKDNCLLVDGGKERWSKFQQPYERAKWFEPSLEGLKRQMRNAYVNQQVVQARAIDFSEYIRMQWTWKNTVDKIEKRIQELS